MPCALGATTRDRAADYDGVNLLPSAARVGARDVRRAAEVWWEWRSHADKYVTLVLLGRRVATAAGVPVDYSLPGMWGHCLILPHPSGQNRMWNDRETWTT